MHQSEIKSVRYTCLCVTNNTVEQEKEGPTTTEQVMGLTTPGSNNRASDGTDHSCEQQQSKLWDWPLLGSCKLVPESHIHNDSTPGPNARHQNASKKLPRSSTHNTINRKHNWAKSANNRACRNTYLALTYNCQRCTFRQIPLEMYSVQVSTVLDFKVLSTTHRTNKHMATVMSQ